MRCLTNIRIPSASVDRAQRTKTGRSLKRATDAASGRKTPRAPEIPECRAAVVSGITITRTIRAAKAEIHKLDQPAPARC